MKYFPLIWAALWRRKLRTWFTLISVVVAFFLFGMLQGVNLGIDGLFNILNTERLRTAGRINNSAMPLAHLQQMRTVPGVKSVTPLTAINGNFQQSGNGVQVLGVDVDAWFGVIYNMFELPAEQLAALDRTRDGVVIGSEIAKQFNLHVGDRLPLQTTVQNKDGTTNWNFEVVGIYTIPRLPQWATNVIGHYDFINDSRPAGQGKDFVFQYITRVNDKNEYQKVATAMDELFTNSPFQTITMSEEDFVRTLLAQLGNIAYLLNGVVGAVLFTLLFLTANTMTLSVRERIPELAALKTIGFSDRALLTMVLVEVVLLCGVAGGIGLGISSVVFPKLMQAAGPQVGLQGLRIPLSVYEIGTLVALALALVSGLPPALRAMRLNIVDGLANR
ncbi:MAG TPA: FtsX-like permease family protein [Candidatus Acidoferrum sp.]|nr:FtsX-like permease family protein [Candidatus Acidoferrum sp.]